MILRIYFVQQWYGLSETAMEDSLYDVELMRRLIGADMNGVSAETAICELRYFLKAHGLTRTLFKQTKRYLSDRGMVVNESTIVNATVQTEEQSRARTLRNILFGIVKNLWCYRKVRSRGLARNTAISSPCSPWPISIWSGGSIGTNPSRTDGTGLRGSWPCLQAKTILQPSRTIPNST